MKLKHLLTIGVVFAALIAIPWRPEKTGIGVHPDAADPDGVFSSAGDEVFHARWLMQDAGLVQLEVSRRVGESALIWLARAATELEKELASGESVKGWVEPWPVEGAAGSMPSLALDWNEGEHVQCRVQLRKPAARSAKLWSLEAWMVKSALESCFPAARVPE